MRRRKRKDKLLPPEIVAPDTQKSALPKRNSGLTDWCVWGAFLLGLLGLFCVQYEVTTTCTFGNPTPGMVAECGSHPLFGLGFLLLGGTFLCLLIAGVAWVRERHNKRGSAIEQRDSNPLLISNKEEDEQDSSNTGRIVWGLVLTCVLGVPGLIIWVAGRVFPPSVGGTPIVSFPNDPHPAGLTSPPAPAIYPFDPLAYFLLGCALLLLLLAAVAWIRGRYGKPGWFGN